MAIEESGIGESNKPAEAYQTWRREANLGGWGIKVATIFVAAASFLSLYVLSSGSGRLMSRAAVGRGIWALLLVWCVSAGGQDLQRTGTILGKVVDPMGVEIEGVRIAMLEEAHGRKYETYSDCSGRYQLTALPAGNYTVRLEMEGFRAETMTAVPVKPSQVTQLDSNLKIGQSRTSGPIIETDGGPLAFGSITGKVEDFTGAAIPGAQIIATKEPGGVQFKTMTDSAGKYLLPNLLWGEYTVRVEAPGFKTEVKPNILINSEASYPLEVRLAVGEGGGPMVVTADPESAHTNDSAAEEPESSEIRGMVTDGFGAVPTRITAIEKTTRERRETTTDSNGIYRLSRLAPGNYCISFEVPGPRAEVNFSGLETSRTVRLESHAPSIQDVVVPSIRETVEVCSVSCTIETAPPPTPIHSGIVLGVYAENSVTSPGGGLWLKVTLLNKSNHSISIQTNGHIPGFDYELYVYGPCDCPRLIRPNDHSFTKNLKGQKAGNRGRKVGLHLRPGESITDRVWLNTTNQLFPPAIYSVLVMRPDTSTSKHGIANSQQPIVMSNVIKVAVMEPHGK
ncbi:MAG TPA: carboxypeptidase-like regulatory domain-containing protein [Candidatus Angelobacter sp.]